MCLGRVPLSGERRAVLEKEAGRFLRTSSLRARDKTNGPRRVLAVSWGQDQSSRVRDWGGGGETRLVRGMRVTTLRK